MTNEKFTPIYTTRELAELVTKHDEEHPGHGRDCPCENGMISTLRIYFAPVEPFAKAVKPYVPPEIKQEQSKLPHDPNMLKPWLARGDETRREYDWRILHSCYNCG
ncbi:MAG TPA: hypothetical protein DGG94_17310, partial [Micromonosporaceae bacterium]|nr:hypothetical protein [Micromonosporaceae bacterium]